MVTSPTEPPQKSDSCRDPARPSRCMRVTIVNKCRRFRPFLEYIMTYLEMMGLTEIIASDLEWLEWIRYFGRIGSCRFHFSGVDWERIGLNMFIFIPMGNNLSRICCSWWSRSDEQSGEFQDKSRIPKFVLSRNSWLVCSESRPRTFCLTWFPAGSRPWSSANFTEFRGQSNVPTSALIEIGVLYFSSATSWRSAIDWHQNWIFEKWHLAVGISERLSWYRIRWGVARRFGVIWLALSPFPATRLPVKLDHRIMPSFHRSFGPYPDFLIVNCKFSRIQL
jgi:hypothetical protein